MKTSEECQCFLMSMSMRSFLWIRIPVQLYLNFFQHLHSRNLFHLVHGKAHNKATTSTSEHHMVHKIMKHTTFILTLSVPCREVRDSQITEASEAIIIAVEIFEKKASQGRREVFSQVYILYDLSNHLNILLLIF